MSTTTAHAKAAALLWQHWQAGTVLEALPAALRPRDRAEGYAMQAQLPTVSDRRVVGWKIAATSAAGQAHIQVDGPLAGRVLSGQVDADGATVSLAGRRMRVAEPEFAFRFGHALAPRASAYEVGEVLEAVDALHPAIEVPDSRYADFARAGVAQLLADNACAHRFVLGADVSTNVDWRRIDLSTHAVTAELIDAAGKQRTTRRGTGAAVLGDPRIALTWLVNELSSLGLTLARGQWVSTGTCMVPLEVLPGDAVRVDYGVLGRMSVRVSGD